MARGKSVAMIIKAQRERYEKEKEERERAQKQLEGKNCFVFVPRVQKRREAS